MYSYDTRCDSIILPNWFSSLQPMTAHSSSQSHSPADRAACFGIGLAVNLLCRAVGMRICIRVYLTWVLIAMDGLVLSYIIMRDRSCNKEALPCRSVTPISIVSVHFLGCSATYLMHLSLNLFCLPSLLH